MAHSKRNTSRAVFTSHERAVAKLNWSSNSARLNRDSFLPFGSCSLCLEIAREPVACQCGDIFCRECALANLFAQKKEIKRVEKARQHAEFEGARVRVLEDEEEQRRAIRDFELTQSGLVANTSKSATDAAPLQDETGLKIQAGSKRKFTLDEDELSRIVREDKAKARKAIEDEKAAKPHLPSFWTPSLTPDARETKLPATTKKAKALPICPASSETNMHILTLHSLVTIKFNEEIDFPAISEKRRTCPSCLKAFTNSMRPVMAVKCGHVLCFGCVKQFLIPPGQKQHSDPNYSITCFVCDIPLDIKLSKVGETARTHLPTGLVGLKSEGTGFSAKGTNTVEKSGTAFQC